MHRVLILSIAFILSACGANDEPQKIYLIRHAEKLLSDSTGNPPLTEAGIARANKIAEMYADKSIDRIYSTQFDRNMHTIQPLADASGAEIKPYEWQDWEPMINEIIANQQKLKTLVICGHGDNLLPMITYMGGVKPIEKLGDYQHDILFEVVLLPDTTHVNVIAY